MTKSQVVIRYTCRDCGEENSYNQFSTHILCYKCAYKRRMRLDKNSTYVCSECGLQKPGKYFISKTLCKSCAAKIRRALPDTKYSVCIECGRQKPRNEFESKKLCRACSLKLQGLIEVDNGLIVSQRVHDRLWAEAYSQASKNDIDPKYRNARLIGLLTDLIVTISLSLIGLIIFGSWGAVIGVLWGLYLSFLIYDLIVKPYKNRRASRIFVKAAKKTVELVTIRKQKIEEQQLFYNSPEWKKIRAQIIREHQHICNECKQKIIKNEDLTVDHIKPRIKFPKLALEKSNLQILCRKCNSSKGAMYDDDL